MRRSFAILMVALLALAAAPLSAQQGPAAAAKMQIVFSEFDGDKKISSQPYTFYATVGERQRTSVRMGVRVPVMTGGSKEHPETGQYTYMDIGTNIDCAVFPS